MAEVLCRRHSPTRAAARSLVGGFALLACSSILGTATAQADKGSIGVGVSATPLQLHAPLRAGLEYTFPSLYVVNTGTRTSNYRVKIERVGKFSGRDVQASWLHLGRTQLRLRPHKTAFVPVKLTVPKNAAGGDYQTDLVVGTTTHRPGSRAANGASAAVGAAAADKLEFTIAEPGFDWTSPSLVYPLLTMLAGGLLIFTLRRLGYRIEVQRRR